MDLTVVSTSETNGGSETSDARQGYEVKCWGCGLWLILRPFGPLFKCGWCGALSTTTACPPRRSRWKASCTGLIDGAFVCLVLGIMLFIVCGGLWAAFPVLFSTFSLSLLMHSVITFLLSFNTLFNFTMAAKFPAGRPRHILWGQVAVVDKGALEGYSFCDHCKYPKPPRAHHCRSCGTCVLDMDHHCPFIGNCVGLDNHRHFILFLFYTVISSLYVFGMGLYAGSKVWPKVIHITDGPWSSRPNSLSMSVAMAANILTALVSSHGLLSARSLALIYLVIISVAVLAGVGILLHQQLQFLYNGSTYLDSIQTHPKALTNEGWDNFQRIFGTRHPIFWILPKFNLSPEACPKKIHVR